MSWIFAVVDGVRAFDLESDGLSSQGLNEDLHTTTETEDEMESQLLVDVVIGEGVAVFKLLSSEDESLLVQGIPSLSWILVVIFDKNFNSCLVEVLIL